MKKAIANTISAILLAVLLLTFSGCGGSTQKETANLKKESKDSISHEYIDSSGKKEIRRQVTAEKAYISQANHNDMNIAVVFI